MIGWVYIFSNPLYSRIKIGKSVRVPSEGRVHELSGTTETPEPFKTEYQALVGDMDGLERAIHNMFADKRPNKNREFFEMSITEAINGIRHLAPQYGGLKHEDLFYRHIKIHNLKGGDTYEGEVRDGRWHGYGTYT